MAALRRPETDPEGREGVTVRLPEEERLTDEPEERDADEPERLTLPELWRLTEEPERDWLP